MQRGKALALTLLTPIDIEIEMKNTIRSELLMTLAVEVFSKVHPSSRPTEKKRGDRRQRVWKWTPGEVNEWVPREKKERPHKNVHPKSPSSSYRPDLPWR